MEAYPKSFSMLFRKFRLKAGFTTLSQFGRSLASEGLAYDNCVFSYWQQGRRIPRKRKVLLAIITVFMKNSSINIREANEFLTSAQQENLTAKEKQEIFYKDGFIYFPTHMHAKEPTSH